MGLDDDASAALPLPAREEVASYARDAFAAAEGALRSIEDRELWLPAADFYDEGDRVVLDHFGWHLSHAASPGDDRGPERRHRGRGHRHGLAGITRRSGVAVEGRRA